MPQAISNLTAGAAKEPVAGGYAVALHVQNRLCVVVGGGAVGERKARELQAAGARVRVVAPNLTDGLQIEADMGRVELRPGVFQPDDIAGAFLVIAATDDPVVNADVLRQATEQKVLVNRAGSVRDESLHESDFDTMATVRRGDLLIGITTGGAGPAVSAQLRKEIAATYGPEWEAWVALLGQMRRRAQTEITDAPTRTQVLRRLAARDDLRELLVHGGDAEIEKVREEAERMLSSAQATQTTPRGIACPVQ